MLLNPLPPPPPISSLKSKKNSSPSAEHFHRSDKQMNSSKITAKHSTANGLVSPNTSAFEAAGSCPEQSNESSSETDDRSSCEQIILVENCEFEHDVANHPPTDDLREMEMFVHGSSDSVCVLLMEKGSSSDVMALKKIVRFFCVYALCFVLRILRIN